MAVKKKETKKEAKNKIVSKSSDDDEDDEKESIEEDVLIDESAEARKLKAMRDKILSGSSNIENVKVKASKPISEIKKGDKMKIDNLNLEVDGHYIMDEYGSSNEMVIDLFDAKTDKDYQLRYFSDRLEDSLEFFELKEIIYSRVEIKKVEW